jgi:hypothetical protein
MSWLYVPASADSNSASDSPSHQRVQSVMWRGKPLSPRVLSREWKKAGFIRLLSGLTCEPSTLQAGVDAWTSSLRATRANPSVSPASSKARKTQGTSGRTSRGSSATAERPECSSKTSPTICDSEATKSSESYGQWATALRAACLLRRKSARPTSASDCSSWPTPDTGCSPNGHGRRGGKSDNGSQSGQNLDVVAAMWATPRTTDDRHPAPADTKRNTEQLRSQSVRHGPRDHLTVGQESKRLLNPLFVEWLMGWPLRWTDAGPTGSGPAETEWSRWWRLMRSELLRLTSG